MMEKHPKLGSIFSHQGEQAHPEEFSVGPRSKSVAIQTESGSLNYLIKELTARERNILLFDTCKLLGESSGVFVESWLSDIDSMSAFGRIAQGLYRNATPEQLSNFIEGLIKRSLASPGNAANDFDNHFCRYYDHQWLIIAEIYKFNFGGTITELKKKLSNFGLVIPESLKDQPQPEQQVKNPIPTRTIPTPNFASGK